VIAAALALIVAGIVLSLFLGFFGFIIAAVGVVLLVLWFVGVGRRAAERPS
jgi:hypothetical protein